MKTYPPNFRVIDLTVEDLIEIVQNIPNKIIANPLTKDYLNTRKVGLKKLCVIYHWPRQTVYGWVNQRYIPYAKVGRHLMFDLDEIEKWIESSNVKTQTHI